MSVVRLVFGVRVGSQLGWYRNQGLGWEFMAGRSWRPIREDEARAMYRALSEMRYRLAETYKFDEPRYS